MIQKIYEVANYERLMTKKISDNPLDKILTVNDLKFQGETSLSAQSPIPTGTPVDHDNRQSPTSTTF